ncbi:helix-turn-helix domain-containing protein [Actinomadura syzygii]|uniref:Helix-turn-helix domain-containing protein n=1 Tax=Actinomadura syzygii TaxID=1427538 RepID=A0A5D0UJG2_9ACTN|nr:helix-turn-helix domain-containing protein [Actinomadura syzygii]
MNGLDIGSALRELRQAGRQTASTVARHSVMSKSKLSKIENGHLTPSVIDVERILNALGVPEEVKAEFLEAARVAATEAIAWRLYRRLGFHKHQAEIQAIEARTSLLRLFQPSVVPGLLQTPEYARTVLAGKHLTEDVLDRTIGARLQRQEALYDPACGFHFLMTESVLRWQIVPRAMLATQLDRIISLSRLPNVQIAVIQLGTTLPEPPTSSFVMFDARLVIVEIPHCEITTREPKDIELYLAKFQRLSAAALLDDEMRSFVTAIRDELLTERETP